MIDDDGARQSRPVTHQIGADLTTVSVEELAARIALLHAEIARLEGEMGKKQSSRQVAENFFKL